jgi:tetratricopeptide (TPR) repeat protein
MPATAVHQSTKLVAIACALGVFVANANAQAPSAEPILEPAGPAAPAAPAAEPTAPVAISDEPAAEPAVLEEARGHFRQGMAFAEAGNCGAAIQEFEAAYALVMRASALYNIAQCEERLFRYDLAIRYYERYLQEADPDAEDRSAVQAALGTLRNLLGVVHITSNVKAQVWIDDRLAGEAPGDVYVPAGGHSLELRADGFMAATPKSGTTNSAANGRAGYRATWSMAFPTTHRFSATA